VEIRVRDLASAAVGPVDLVRRGVDRDTLRGAECCRSALDVEVASAAAVEVGERDADRRGVVRPIELAGGWIDREPARLADRRDAGVELGGWIRGTNEIGVLDLVVALARPVDPPGRGVDRDARGIVGGQRARVDVPAAAPGEVRR